MEMNDTHINFLKDMILDEGKLVTYLTLAKDLCIHINNSKLLMHTFIKHIREGNPKLELNINFLISGSVDNNKVRVAVCSEDKLEAQKKMFKVIYFLHVYSISKGRPMDNSSAIVTLTKYDDFNLYPGSIKSNVSMKRSDKELANLKSISQKKIEELPLKKAKQEDKVLKNVQEVSGKTLKSDSGSDKEIKKEIVSPKKDLKPQNRLGNQKGIAGFFSKENGNGKKKENKKVVNLNPNTQKTVDLNLKTEQDTFVDKMDVDNQEEIEDREDAKKELKIVHDNKILNHIKKHSKVDKKRKRVLHVSDSDSEVENDPFVAEDEKSKETPESDEEIPPTPATNNLKITTGIVNPRKKRKVVDKTYMSDDGYIITKREEIYESCSDSESMEKEMSDKIKIKEEKLVISPKTKPKEIKNTPKKKKLSPPQKGKQATLMNFFSKK